MLEEITVFRNGEERWTMVKRRYKPEGLEKEDKEDTGDIAARNVIASLTSKTGN